MNVAIIAEDGRDLTPWKECVEKISDKIQVSVWPKISDTDNIDVLMIWKYTKGSLLQYKNVKLICSMGAGVDHLIFDEQLPNVPITRIVDPGLTLEMQKYAVMAVLNIHKSTFKFRTDQLNKVWNPYYTPESKLVVGLMGLGELGSNIGKSLVSLGYETIGYSNSPKNLKNITTYSGIIEREQFLKKTDLLIAVLPLTNETKDLFDYSFFKQMKKGSVFINIGRGLQCVENDLILALEEKHLSGAYLDVFRNEPLPENDPLWDRDDIIITPHVAGVTRPKEASEVMFENYQRLSKGEKLLNQVNLQKGY